jgi:carbamate kinase
MTAKTDTPLLRTAAVRQFGSGRPLIVVAFGGNALLQAGDDGSASQQQKRAEAAAKVLHGIARRGYRILLVHGNGPQVGQELIRSEEAATKLPIVPLDACVASTQGTMGFQLEVALHNQSHTLRVGTVLTLVEVDAKDEGFKQPTKPIGPFFPAHRARELQKRLKWPMVEDAGRGWRKVVASPRPTGIVNVEAIEAVVSRADVVIAGGGGGVPVVRGARGRLQGVEAVIDKDRTAALLGQVLGAQMLVILTAVDHISLDFGKPGERRIDAMGASEAEGHLRDGQFPPGSMGPKVEAAIEFTRVSGQPTAIGSVEKIAGIVQGRAGTRIVPD